MTAHPETVNPITAHSMTADSMTASSMTAGPAAIVECDQPDPRVHDTLAAVVSGAARLVSGACHASFTPAAESVLAPPAFSDETAQGLDRAQRELGQGPSLDALQDRDPVTSADLRRDLRWPELARRAQELDVASVMSLQLTARNRGLGVLNVYAAQVAAFTTRDGQAGLLLAAQASIALAATADVLNLRRALASRDIIGQAKGILMQRDKITAEEAFTLLIHRSQCQNRKLAEVAAELVRTGQ